MHTLGEGGGAQEGRPKEGMQAVPFPQYLGLSGLEEWKSPAARLLAHSPRSSDG